MLLSQFYPSAYVDSVFSINYSKLYDIGYRALIFDIDNTLTHHGEDSTAEVDDLFRKLHQSGFKTILLSNNSKERIERFIRNIDTLYIEDANKPETDGYQKALEALRIEKDRVVCIGDQVFTDIRGANRIGLDSILVKYMRYPNERKIGIRRRVEKVIVWCYRCSPSHRNKLGNIEKEGSRGTT